MHIWRRFSVGLTLVGLLGCGGNESYLPPPRISNDEEESAAVVPQPTAATTAASADAVSAGQLAEAVAAKARPSPPAPDANLPAGQVATPAAGVMPDSSAVSAEHQASLSEREGRQRVIDQLSQIGRAWQMYEGRNESPPPQFFGPQRFSWRVLLLSELGEDDLYSRFSLVAPWDGEPNRGLLARIPSVFRSFDDPQGRTTMVLVTGPNTLYPGEQTAPLRDGAENTILVIAVAASRAVPWTAAQDYEFDAASAHEDLFGLYQDCCYALFGGKTGVRRIPATISDEQLLALLTPDGGESISALDVTRAATPEPDDELRRYLREHPVVRFAHRQADSIATAPSVSRPATGPAAAASGAAVPATTDAAAGHRSVPATADGLSRLAVPDPTVQQFARRVLREIHHRDYEEATTAETKRKLAEKLLALGQSLNEDPAGRFVALQACRKIAMEAGAISTGLAAVEAIVRNFECDGVREKAEVLNGSLGHNVSEAENQEILRVAGPTFKAALQADAHDAAEQILAAALAAARRLGDTKLIAELATVRKELMAARKAWTAVEDHIVILQTAPHHPAANQELGAYYCFVKQRWDDGLPLLARSDNPRLVAIAKLEADRPQTPDQQIAVGDAWWQLAETAREHASAMRSRSAFWYRQALPALAPGLERIKAETRMARAAADEVGFAQTSTGNETRK